MDCVSWSLMKRKMKLLYFANEPIRNSETGRSPMSHSRAQREPRPVFLFLSLVSCWSYYEYYVRCCTSIGTAVAHTERRPATAAAASSSSSNSSRSLHSVTSNVLPTMSLLAVASELPASMCVAGTGAQRSRRSFCRVSS